MKPRAASCAIASAPGALSGTSVNRVRGANFATAVWSVYMQKMNSLFQLPGTPSSIHPRKTAPGFAVATSRAGVPVSQVGLDGDASAWPGPITEIVKVWVVVGGGMVILQRTSAVAPAASATLWSRLASAARSVWADIDSKRA